MTKFLFREDPYLCELVARVISINENTLTLDRTIFYAFSGGQQSDSGTINGINVVDAKKIGEEIYYVLEEKPKFNVGDEVEIKIDFKKREILRRIHSAAHIVGDIFEKEHNMPMSDIIGSNVDTSKARLDYLFEENVGELLVELEHKVNNFISKNHEVNHFVQDEDIWMWECCDIKLPCGGTHVRNTSEIGEIKLKRKNIGAGKERIEVYLV